MGKKGVDVFELTCAEMFKEWKQRRLNEGSQFKSKYITLTLIDYTDFKHKEINTYLDVKELKVEENKFIVVSSKPLKWRAISFYGFGYARCDKGKSFIVFKGDAGTTKIKHLAKVQNSNDLISGSIIREPRQPISHFPVDERAMIHISQKTVDCADIYKLRIDALKSHKINERRLINFPVIYGFSNKEVSKSDNRDHILVEGSDKEGTDFKTTRPMEWMMLKFYPNGFSECVSGKDTIYIRTFGSQPKDPDNFPTIVDFYLDNIFDTLRKVAYSATDPPGPAPIFPSYQMPIDYNTFKAIPTNLEGMRCSQMVSKWIEKSNIYGANNQYIPLLLIDNAAYIDNRLKVAPQDDRYKTLDPVNWWFLRIFPNGSVECKNGHSNIVVDATPEKMVKAVFKIGDLPEDILHPVDKQVQNRDPLPPTVLPVSNTLIQKIFVKPGKLQDMDALFKHYNNYFKVDECNNNSPSFVFLSQDVLDRKTISVPDNNQDIRILPKPLNWLLFDFNSEGVPRMTKQYGEISVRVALDKDGWRVVDIFNAKNGQEVKFSNEQTTKLGKDVKSKCKRRLRIK